MDHGPRYQLLDHATKDSALWDARNGIQEVRGDAPRIELHRDRSPEELRPDLEQLLRDGHVELYEMTDPQQRVLSLDEALAAIVDEKNWYSPEELGSTERRETIYALSLTESGGDEFRQERSRADQG